jgi:hypothetical protein
MVRCVGNHKHCQKYKKIDEKSEDDGFIESPREIVVTNCISRRSLGGADRTSLHKYYSAIQFRDLLDFKFGIAFQHQNNPTTKNRGFLWTRT